MRKVDDTWAREMLGRVAQTSPDPMVVVDDRGVILEASGTAPQWLESDGPLRGRPLREWFDAEGIARLRDLLADENTPANRSLVLHRRSGGPALALAGRASAGWRVAFVRPRSLEQQLRYLERVIDEVLNLLPHGVTVSDGVSRLAYVNDATCTLLGYAREELTTMPMAEVLGRILDEEVARQVVATVGVRTTGAQTLYDLTLTRADGSRFPALVRGSSVLDEQGRFLASIGTWDVKDPESVARAALAEEREKAARLLDLTPALVVMLDVAGRISMINQEGARLLGASSPAELTGLGWFERFVPASEQVALREEVFHKLLREGDGPVVRHSNRVQTLHGEVRHLSWSNTVVRDGAGRVTGTLSLGIDTTAEVRALEGVTARDRILAAVGAAAEAVAGSLDLGRIAEQVLQELGEATGATRVCLLEVEAGSPEHQFRRYSKAHAWVREGFGDASDIRELEGRSAADVGFARWGDLTRGQRSVQLLARDLPPEEQAALAQPVKSFLLVPMLIEGEVGGSLVLEDWETDRLWHPSEVQAIEVAVRMFAAAAQRQRAERALRASEERYRRLVESMGEGLYVTDERDRITYANAEFCRIVDRAESEVIGAPAEALLGRRREDSGRVRPAETADRVAQDVRLVTPSGERAVILSPQALVNDRGEVAGRLTVVTDITDRLRIEQALERSLLQKEVLLREVHHRVKNNLQVVCSLLRLQGRRHPNSDVKNALREAQVRIRSMALAHQALSESEDVSEIDVNVYLADLVDNLRDGHVVDAARVVTTVASTCSSLSLERAVPLGLILTEALCNAYEHAFPNNRTGRVEVSLEEGANDLVLRVSDDGVGLPPHFAVSSPQTLGFQLIRALVQQIGGELRVGEGPGLTLEVEMSKETRRGST